MTSKFTTCDRDTPYLLPPSIQDWLPEKHLARFVVEIIDQCDVSAFEKKYSMLGRQAYPIHMMLSLLFYGYITGVHSSRKIEQATYESVPFMYIAANNHPDHDSIAHFRKRFLTELKDTFLQILKIASTMNILKMGKVSTDGSKIKANASKHKALSWEHANKLEEQLKSEVEQLMKLAEDADDIAIPKDMSIPDELSRRKTRLQAIEEAKKKIEKRAEERYQIEKIEYDEKLDQRKKTEEASGKNNNRKLPNPPTQGPKKNDQINLTDEASRIMPKSGGGFEQSYNAQASVDIESMLIVANYVTQQSNDKQQIAPMIEQIKKTETVIGKCSGLLADAGYFSKDNVERCETAQIAPLIVDKRDKHNQSLMARFEEPSKLPENADAVTKMKYELKTKEGKALYAKRKTTVEPVFGIIKNVMKFRSFSLRGIEAVDGEWNIVSIAWNIKRMFSLAV